MLRTVLPASPAVLRPLLLKLMATGLFVLVFVNGYLIGHYVNPPDPPVTGSQADSITKYCYHVTSADLNSLPEPFRSAVASFVSNGTGSHQVYICGNSH